MIKSTWDKRTCKLLDNLDLENFTRIACIESRSFINLVKKSLFRNDQIQWHSDLWNDRNNENGNKLRTYRLFKNRLQPSHYIKLNIPLYQRQCLANLRCGSLPLAIETGRFSTPVTPLSNRLCKFCNLNCIED